MQAFVRLMHTPLGYDPHNVLPVWIPLHDGSLTTWADRRIWGQSSYQEVACYGLILRRIVAAKDPKEGGRALHGVALNSNAFYRH